MSWNISRGVLITCLTIFGLLVFVPLMGSKYLIDLSTEIMVYALFALSLNVIIGFSGNVSFGHAAYFAIGGYANAILLTTYGWPLIFAFPAAIILSALAAAFVAYFCTRLTDIYFAMLTLAFSMLVWAIAFKWRSVTGGDDGFVGVTVPSFIDGRVPFFYFTLIIVTASIIILWLICHSAFGQTLIAVRENLTRAGFIGVNTRMMRGIAFVIATAMYFELLFKGVTFFDYKLFANITISASLLTIPETLCTLDKRKINRRNLPVEWWSRFRVRLINDRYVDTMHSARVVSQPVYTVPVCFICTSKSEQLFAAFKEKDK